MTRKETKMNVHSTSRAWEKAYKRNSNKKVRQDNRKASKEGA